MWLFNEGGMMARQHRGEWEGEGHDRRRTGLAWWQRAVLGLVIGGLSACGPASDTQLPPNVQDPATLQTPSGALARYRNAIAHLGRTLDYAITSSGIITDELAAVRVQLGVEGPYSAADSRTSLLGLSGGNAMNLNRLRAQAREARGFLAAYAPEDSALQAHMFGLEAYAEVLLADLFCSGIPLSTLDFNGNYTLAGGSSTNDVYRHALALFDSAVALVADSMRVQYLIAVGRGRTLLALDRPAEAAAAVSGVPDDYRYQAQFDHRVVYDVAPPDSAILWWFRSVYSRGTPVVANNEGTNGLDYRSSGDPRAESDTVGADSLGNLIYAPAKYPAVPTFFNLASTFFTLANGVEARLIEAEAALRANAGDGRWLELLNHLRQTAWSTIVVSPTSAWIPGPLPDLADPGSDTARVSLLFRERAFWLYLTAHRQGDLRRLIRQYPGRSIANVYPTGIYPGYLGSYGDEIVIPFPASEAELNTNYTGCLHRDA